MRRFGTLTFVLMFLAVAFGPSMAQSVNVTIDGASVRFTGTQPMVVGGRVLVPLRGVLEQMGAFVGWDPATRTVFAQKSGIDVQLPIGSRIATVNGRTVTLDTPAQITRGSTMVPLRFLSEALGSDVEWDNATRTVMITTSSSTVPPVVGPTPTLDITSFTQNAKDWLKAGSTLEVVMEGTSVVYQGRYTVPKGQDLDGATISGTLKVSSGQTYAVASEGTITLSTGGLVTGSRPVVTAPVAGSAVVLPPVITGTASPNSSVYLSVAYSATVFGVCNATGELSDQTVTVNPQGGYKSSPINLTTLIKGKNTVYTITATTVSATGEESEPTTVTVKGS